MAHTLSAKKRMRQNAKSRALNRWRKRQIHGEVRDFLEAVQTGDAASAEQAYKKAARTLDKVAAKGTIHKNAAARRKSRLAKRLNAMTKSDS